MARFVAIEGLLAALSGQTNEAVTTERPLRAES
jgi:hypothetical protein